MAKITQPYCKFSKAYFKVSTFCFSTKYFCADDENSYHKVMNFYQNIEVNLIKFKSILYIYI